MFLQGILPVLGISDPWLMSLLSQQLSNPATQRIILKIVGFQLQKGLDHIVEMVDHRSLVLRISRGTEKSLWCHHKSNKLQGGTREPG